VVNAADALLDKGRDRGLRLHHPRRALRRRSRPPSPPLRLKELVITDLDSTHSGGQRNARNIRTLSVASLIGEAIGPPPRPKEIGVEPIRLTRLRKLRPRGVRREDFLPPAMLISSLLGGWQTETCGETTPRRRDIHQTVRPRRSPIVL